MIRNQNLVLGVEERRLRRVRRVRRVLRVRGGTLVESAA